MINKNNKRFNVTISKESYAFLDFVSKEMHLSKSKIVKRLLDRLYLDLKKLTESSK